MELLLRFNGRVYNCELFDRGDKIDLKFPYSESLKNELKESLSEARWNPSSKCWSYDNDQRAKFILDYLQGKPVFGIFDIPLVEYTPSRTLYSHQVDMVRHVLTRKCAILAAEMGCVDGEAIVHVNRAGKGFQITLRNLFRKFQGYQDRGKAWDLSIPTYIRSNCDGILRLNLIRNVLSKGKKKTLKITTKRGYSIKVTPDHEIAVSNTDYVAAELLKIGDTILVNGKWIDKDGYVRVGGLKGKHPRWTTGGVYEHILVMEEKLGRYVESNEIVHHINEIRHDNRPENLELKESQSEHAKEHGKNNFVNLHNGDRVQFIPQEDIIVSVEESDEISVFDIVCDDPHRNFVANGIVVHNCGKTLSAIEFIEASNKQRWWYVAPRAALESVKRELGKWKAKVYPQLMTYEEMVRTLKGWTSGNTPPEGVVFDESSRLKTPTAQRTKAAQHLADNIRKYYGSEAMVILMSGSPAPKSPWDWWSQCEIARPGFLREGNYKHFQNRVSLIKMEDNAGGYKYPRLLTHKDNINKCGVCGNLNDHEIHKTDTFSQLTYVATTQGLHESEVPHQFKPMTNEVELLHKRLDGLVMVKFKKDCLELPEKIYHTIELKPSAVMKRTAKLIAKAAPSAAQCLILLRELSDGFQYHEQLKETKKCEYCTGGKQSIHDTNEDGTHKTNENGTPIFVKRDCIHCGGKSFFKIYEQVAVECDTPKTDALMSLLEDHEEDGRLICYAGFTSSIDRVCSIVRKAGWKYIRVDGRGWNSDIGPSDPQKLLDIFQDKIIEHPKVCFVGHPASAGMGLTLTASKSIVYYSNDFNAESRIQSEDRIHRPGSRGANIFDLIHLDVDRLVLENLKAKRGIQAITLGDIRNSIEKDN